MFRNLLGRALSSNPPADKQSHRAEHEQGDHDPKSHTPAAKGLKDSVAVAGYEGGGPDLSCLPVPGPRQFSASRTDSLPENDCPEQFSSQLESPENELSGLLQQNQQEHSTMQAVQQQHARLHDWQQDQAAAYAAEQHTKQLPGMLLGDQKTQETMQRQPQQLTTPLQPCSTMQQQPRTDASPTIQQLQMELNLQQRAREELEDMLLRYERQLKAESAARSTAEQKAAAAAAAADLARQQLASSGRQAKQRTACLAAEEEAVRQERAALESMRVDFEGQLQTARAEVAKAQAAMRSTEERVRAVEAAERASLASEYEAHTAALMAELERLRAELSHRTASMTAEMNRWKHQAALTAAAVVEAKNEVMERQRELHSTNTKMDHLIERLYGHREASIVLSGAIGAAAEHQQAATHNFLQQQAAMAAYAPLHSTGSMQATQQLMMSRTAQHGQLALSCPEPADSRSLQYAAADTARHHVGPSNRAGYSSAPKVSGSRASNALVPTTVQQRKAAKSQQHTAVHDAAAAAMLSGTGALQNHLPAPSWQHSQLFPVRQANHLSSSSKIPLPFLAAAIGDASMSTSSRACTWLPLAQTGGTQAVRNSANSNHQPVVLQHPPQQQVRPKDTGVGHHRVSASNKSPKAAGSYAMLHQQQQLAPVSPGAGSCDAKADGAYTQTSSKYADSAAKYVQSHQLKAKQQQKQREKSQKPDRFAEGAKNAAMITAMASRW